jgi:hypothetical protein
VNSLPTLFFNSIAFEYTKNITIELISIEKIEIITMKTAKYTNEINICDVAIDEKPSNELKV